MKLTCTIQTDLKNAYLTPKIGVSSTADGSFLKQESYELAKDLGKENFLKSSDKDIFEKAKELMDLPSKPTQITDENGNNLSL